MDTCTVPGSAKEDRIGTGKAELGLGIHGEPGAQQIPYRDPCDAMERVAEKMAARLQQGQYVALQNNLGATTKLEMSILARELRHSTIGASISHIIGPAAMMTALDMHGFSLTLYPLGEEDAVLIGADTTVRAWPGMKPFSAPVIVPLPAGIERLSLAPSANPANRAVLMHACKALITAEADLNVLDAKLGDGDTGSTLATAAKALIARMDQLPLADLTQLHTAIGQELSQTMGGSSGVLMAILFAATGDAFSRGLGLVAAFKMGLERVQEVGGAKLGDRTMIDALHPSLDALPRGLREAAIAARSGAMPTASMYRAQAGRAAYINADQLDGHIDPGAEAVARLFECLSEIAAPV